MSTIRRHSDDGLEKPLYSTHIASQRIFTWAMSVTTQIYKPILNIFRN